MDTTPTPTQKRHDKQWSKFCDLLDEIERAMWPHNIRPSNSTPKQAAKNLRKVLKFYERKVMLKTKAWK